VSEDRTKHSEAGKGDKAGLGHKVGKSVSDRRTKSATEGSAGMGQYIPDSVRDRVREGDKPAKGRGRTK
jgi:hypothetical protein